MRVRTKRKHGNGYGDTYEKNPGKQYDVPDEAAAVLIDQGYVEEVQEEAAGTDEA